MDAEKTQIGNANSRVVNETTNLDNAPKNAAAQTQPVKNEKKNAKNAGFAAGLAGAAAAGVGATVLMGSTTETAADNANQPSENDTPTPEPQAAHVTPSWTDGQINIAFTVNDDMSFADAFAAARAEVGPGGAFEWHGKVYNTYYKSEWQNLSDSDRAEYESHFAWNHHNNAHHDNLAHNDTDHNTDNIVPGDHPTDDLVKGDEVHVVNGEDEILVTPEDEDDSVVEVLGVGYDDEIGANVGIVSVDGNEAILLDVDLDETFDFLAADSNGDGVISPEELYDISESSLTVDDLGGFSNNTVDDVTEDYTDNIVSDDMVDL